jgi:hypothetical protein
LDSEEILEIKTRGIGLKMLEISENIKSKNRNKYPKLCPKEINKKSRKEIFTEIEKQTKEIRNLRIEILLSLK